MVATAVARPRSGESKENSGVQLREYNEGTIDVYIRCGAWEGEFSQDEATFLRGLHDSRVSRAWSPDGQEKQVVPQSLVDAPNRYVAEIVLQIAQSTKFKDSPDSEYPQFNREYRRGSALHALSQMNLEGLDFVHEKGQEILLDSRLSVRLRKQAAECLAKIGHTVTDLEAQKEVAELIVGSSVFSDPIESPFVTPKESLLDILPTGRDLAGWMRKKIQEINSDLSNGVKREGELRNLLVLAGKVDDPIVHIAITANTFRKDFAYAAACGLAISCHESHPSHESSRNELRELIADGTVMVGAELAKYLRQSFAGRDAGEIKDAIIASLGEPTFKAPISHANPDDNWPNLQIRAQWSSGIQLVRDINTDEDTAALLDRLEAEALKKVSRIE